VNPQYIVRTLGCKANLYDSQLLEEELQKKGWLPLDPNQSQGRGDEVKLCIVNSCTVTNEADRQTRKTAQKLAREYPHAAIVVTGCAAEVDPEALAQSQGIHFVIGNQNKNELIQLVLDRVATPSFQTSDILGTEILGSVKNYSEILSRHPIDRDWPSASDSFSKPPTQLKGVSSKTRSFLKIQEGCNSFCTYCIIPYGRGPNRSLRPREVLDQIRTLVDEGIQEIVITGTNIGDYGTDWGGKPLLDELLKMILNETSLKRLRVSSLDPTEITPSILELMESDSRLCPHFHVSLQSPHSRILKLMKRKYGFEQVQETLQRIAQISGPVGGVYVGMDIITGFPGESEEEFEWGMKVLSQLPWSRLHVFPYSEREGTPATRLPSSVPQSKRVHRTRLLNQLSLERLTRHYQSILAQIQNENLSLDSILMERTSDGEWISGYTPNYLRVLIPQTDAIERNQLISAKPLDLMIDSKANDVAFVAKFEPHPV
jgi:threonylcarbamoyladenosine tRNA methylthiotransferase MtaB